MKSAGSMKRTADRFGIALSTLCLLHCLSVPIALAVLPVLAQAPVLGVLHDSEWIHAALLVPILLISGPVLFQGSRKDKYVGYLGVLGIGILCAALFIHIESIEQIITACGTVTLITAHIFNLRNRQIEAV